MRDASDKDLVKEFKAAGINEEIESSTGTPAIFEHSTPAIADVVMLMCWTKSGLDFIAPTLWGEVDLACPAQVAVLLTAVFWFGGCMVWLYGLWRSVKTDHWVAVGFVLSGISYGYAIIQYILQAQAAGASMRDSIVTIPMLSAVVGTSIWIIAAASWLQAALKIWATQNSERIVISLWALVGLTLYGAAMEPTLDSATRWCYIWCATWWNVGVSAWGLHVKRGGSFFI